MDHEAAVQVRKGIETRRLENLIGWRPGREFRCSPADRECGPEEGVVVAEGGSWGDPGPPRCNPAQGAECRRS